MFLRAFVLNLCPPNTPIIGRKAKVKVLEDGRRTPERDREQRGLKGEVGRAGRWEGVGGGGGKQKGSEGRGKAGRDGGKRGSGRACGGEKSGGGRGGVGKRGG